jgi:two-component system chemotaxis response regulator CheY
MPDLIFLDLHMRGSFEFLGELRSGINGHMPKVIVCAIESDDPEIRLALDGGADDYFLKPFDGWIMEAKRVELGLREASSEASFGT